MAVGKPRTKRGAPPQPAQRRPASAAASTVTAVAMPERRRGERETLRLRTIEPVLTVSDLPASLRFYTDVLGFIVGDQFKNDHGALTAVTLKAGACQLGLSHDDSKKGRDRPRGPGVRLWCKTVQDIDALAERIRSSGGRLTEGPTDQSRGVRSLAVDDPDGYHLTIYQDVAFIPVPNQTIR